MFSNALWRYRGSTSSADYYGGEIPGQALSISPTGDVSFSDRNLGIAAASGMYAEGAFQFVPVAIHGVTASGAPWAPLPPGGSFPPAVTVNGQVWSYSTALSSPGHPVYQGTQSGQRLSLNGSTAVLADVSAGTFLTGIYAGGKFTFAGTALRVKNANADGTPIETAGSSGSGDIVGNLDVSGNAFTLGSWVNGAGDSINGFALSFTTGAQGSLLRFDATRFLTDWLWTRVKAADATQPLDAMRLGSTNILTLYTPADPPVAGIVLDPGGRSRFDRPVRIAPQGDISMGAFTSEPAVP